MLAERRAISPAAEARDQGQRPEGRAGRRAGVPHPERLPKMSYHPAPAPNPKQEIQSILRANDIEQVSLGLELPGSQPPGPRGSARVHPLCAQDQQADRAPRAHQQALRRTALRLARVGGGAPGGAARGAQGDQPGGQRRAAAAGPGLRHLTASSKQRKVIITQRSRPTSELIKEARRRWARSSSPSRGRAERRRCSPSSGRRLTAWNE